MAFRSSPHAQDNVPEAGARCRRREIGCCGCAGCAGRAVCWHSRVLLLAGSTPAPASCISPGKHMRRAQRCPECVTGVVPVSPALQLTFWLCLRLSD